MIPDEVLPRFPEKREIGQARVKLQRDSSREGAPNLLAVTLDEWAGYAATAPETRLSKLTFAASDEVALIRGLPLPPIPGQTWIEENGIALPSGFRLDPPVSPDVLRNALEVTGGDLVLFYPDGEIDRIALENFVPASRVSVRKTVNKK